MSYFAQLSIYVALKCFTHAIQLVLRGPSKLVLAVITALASRKAAYQKSDSATTLHDLYKAALVSQSAVEERGRAGGRSGGRSVRALRKTNLRVAAAVATLSQSVGPCALLMQPRSAQHSKARPIGPIRHSPTEGKRGGIRTYSRWIEYRYQIKAKKKQAC